MILPTQHFIHVNYYYFRRGNPGLYQQSALHSGVHVWVGGSWVVNSAQWVGKPAMGDLLDMHTSPNDPLFFSHHANIDRMYYLWRQRIGVSVYILFIYRHVKVLCVR